LSFGITGNLENDAGVGHAALEKRQHNGDQILELKTLPQNENARDASIPESSSSRFMVSEDSIRLAARLQASAADGQLIVFTGTHEDDGVATVATQVALAMVHAGVRPVLLIDANVHAPSIHKTFDIDIAPGLAQLLEGSSTIESVIHGLGEVDLWILPAGSRAHDSASLFSSAVFSRFFNEIKKQFRFVIVNSPPILDHAESVVIAGRSDGVVMVLAAGARTRTDLRKIKDELDGVKARLLGAVLSKT